MVFIEYEREKSALQDAEAVVKEVLTEKERLFQRTQPKAQKFDEEKVDASPQGNKFDDYLIQLERRRLDERLIEAREIVEIRAELLERKEGELRASSDVNDRIYTLLLLDGLKPSEVADRIGYSRTQLYRKTIFIREILKNETKRNKMEQNGTK